MVRIFTSRYVSNQYGWRHGLRGHLGYSVKSFAQDMGRLLSDIAPERCNRRSHNLLLPLPQT